MSTSADAAAAARKLRILSGSERRLQRLKDLQRQESAGAAGFTTDGTPEAVAAEAAAVAAAVAPTGANASATCTPAAELGAGSEQVATSQKAACTMSGPGVVQSPGVGAGGGDAGPPPPPGTLPLASSRRGLPQLPPSPPTPPRTVNALEAAGPANSPVVVGPSALAMPVSSPGSFSTSTSTPASASSSAGAPLDALGPAPPPPVPAASTPFASTPFARGCATPASLAPPPLVATRLPITLCFGAWQRHLHWLGAAVVVLFAVGLAWGLHNGAGAAARAGLGAEDVDEEDLFFHGHLDGDLGALGGPMGCGGPESWWMSLPLPLLLLAALVAKWAAAGLPPLAAAMAKGNTGLLPLASSAYSTLPWLLDAGRLFCLAVFLFAVGSATGSALA